MITNVITTLQAIVQGLGKKVPYYSMVTTTTSYRIFTKQTLWLRGGDRIVIGGKAYTVNFQLCGQYLDVAKGTEGPPPSAGTFDAPDVFFAHGPVRRVNNELLSIGIADQFCPLIYMVEPTTSKQPLDPKSLFSDIADLRLFILEQSNVEDWQKASEYYAGAIIRTDLIAKALIQAFMRSSLVGKLTETRTWNHINAGSYTDKGHEKNLFDYYFSGTEMRVSLPIVKQCC